MQIGSKTSNVLHDSNSIYDWGEVGALKIVLLSLSALG